MINGTGNNIQYSMPADASERPNVRNALNGRPADNDTYYRAEAYISGIFHRVKQLGYCDQSMIDDVEFLMDEQRRCRLASLYAVLR